MNPSSLRIFAEQSPVGRGPVRAHVEAPVPTTAIEPATTSADNAIEREVVRILDATPDSGESVQRTFDRKERELCELFVTLTPEERRALHDALTAEVETSRVAARIRRLTAERRARVLGSLVSTARRKAISQ